MRKPMKILILLLLMIFVLSATLNGCKAYQRSNPSPKQLPVEGQIATGFSAVLFIVIAIYFIVKGFNDDRDSNNKKRSKRNYK